MKAPETPHEAARQLIGTVSQFLMALNPNKLTQRELDALSLVEKALRRAESMFPATQTER